MLNSSVDYPLRPIISQCPTPTYNIAKQLNTILTPYIPDNYCVKSPTEVIELLKANNEHGIMASYDVESLFTNVPVDKTIKFILDRIYRDNTTPNLDIKEEHLKKLLELCTKESPFTSPQGQLYQQIDGVAMGSPLGVFFANFYMCTVENKVLKKFRKPTIYCRYIEDIFIVVKFQRDVIQLNKLLSIQSGLEFTTENSNNNQLNYLDIIVNQLNNKFHTSVYIKPTNNGLCMNGSSECPDRYKRSVILSYVRFALSRSQTSSHQTISHQH